MRRFGLIGKTLEHSFSKKYFTGKFAKEGIGDAVYELYELASIEDLPSLLERVPGLEGLNVTIPYKEVVLPFLQAQDELVTSAGACNCIRIRDGKLEGFNTDIPAFKGSLQKMLRPHHNCALVLGSGGASKAVQYALRELGMEY